MADNQDNNLSDVYKNVVLQRELLRRGITYPSFSHSVLNRACPELFVGHEDYWTICKVLKYYYNVHDEPITEQVLIQRTLKYIAQTTKNATDDDFSSIIDSIHDVVASEPDNSSTMLQTLEQYVKSQLNYKALVDEVNKSLAKGEKTLSTNTVQKLRERFDQNDLISITGEDEDLMDVIQEEDPNYYLQLMASLYEDRISTGFKQLDKVLGGGLARGEVGLVGAMYGSGKTLVLNSIACSYVRRGYNVLYVALEEKKNRMFFRFMQCLTQIPKQRFYNPVTKNADVNTLGYGLKMLRESHPKLGKFKFYRKSPKTISIDHIEKLITHIQFKYQFSVDVIVIDYPDLLINPDAIGDVSEDGGRMFENLRRMTQQFNAVLWVATQLGRGAQSAAVKTMEFVEGSKKKLNAVEVAMTVNASKEERRAGYMRFCMDKVRNPEDYVEFINLKADGDRQTVRDETPEEESFHRSLLDDEENGIKAERKEKWAKKEQEHVQSEQDKANGINDLLGGTGS